MTQDRATTPINKGDTIQYKLRPDQRPTNPHKIWLGIVKRIHEYTSYQGNKKIMYYVQVEDYPDDDGEWVYDTQVVEVQPHGAT